MHIILLCVLFNSLSIVFLDIIMPQNIFNFVFVVLVYRNTQDLKDFFSSLSIPNSKVVVVNSFYNDETKSEFEQIAIDNGADFLNVENKGYGYGNNRGCEFALQHYQFKYLIISNADIEIQKLSIDQLSENHITAPEIITLKNKKQNPYLPFLSKCYEKTKYFLIKRRSRLTIFCWIFSRLIREIYLLFHKRGYVFAAHGAFFILPYNILKTLYPLYNEKMFLFVEEEHVAMLAREKGIKIYYDSSIVIKHKEDGSVSFLNNINEIQLQSFTEFYNTWFK